MLNFVTSYMKQNKSRKQTLESGQYRLEISFNDSKSYILKLFFLLCFLAFSFNPKSHKNQISPQY